MQALFKNIRDDFKKYNIVSKYIIKIGTVILFCLILIALALKYYILRTGADCSTQLLFEDLLECIKESFGAIYLGALVLEMLYLKKDK